MDKLSQSLGYSHHFIILDTRHLLDQWNILKKRPPYHSPTPPRSLAHYLSSSRTNLNANTHRLPSPRLIQPHLRHYSQTNLPQHDYDSRLSHCGSLDSFPLRTPTKFQVSCYVFFARIGGRGCVFVLFAEPEGLLLSSWRCSWR